MPRTGRMTVADVRIGNPAAVAALLLAGCTPPAVAPEATVGAMTTTTYGWVEGRCLAVQAPLQTPSQTVWIVPVTKGKAMVEARVAAKVDPMSADAAAACNALHPDRAMINRDGHVFYRLDVAQPLDLAIVALGPADKAAHDYGVCFTTEGVRFTVRQGKRLEWEDYYYLGYDVEPTCG